MSVTENKKINSKGEVVESDTHTYISKVTDTVVNVTDNISGLLPSTNWENNEHIITVKLAVVRKKGVFKNSVTVIEVWDGSKYVRR